VSLQGLNITQLVDSISKPRLKSYSILTGSQDTLALIGAYQWNKKIAAAIYPIIQCLEVSLRNATHLAATAHFGTPNWYGSVTKHVGNKSYQAFIKKNPHEIGNYYRKGLTPSLRSNAKSWTSHHENMILAARKRLQENKKTVRPDAVIAELMLGFWVGLFQREYNDIHSSNLLWPHLEPVVFPNLLAHERKHSVIKQKLEVVKDIRNRISHHEPIWKNATVRTPQDAIHYLMTTVKDAVRLIEGMSQERVKLLTLSGQIATFDNLCDITVLTSYINGQIQ
jgi:hypothetical protein